MVQGINEHDIKLLAATLEPDDTIGRSSFEEMRAGTTHLEAEIAAIYGVSLDAKHTALQRRGFTAVAPRSPC